MAKVKLNAPMGAFCIFSTFIRLQFVIKIFVLSIFEWLFYTGFTVLITFLCREDSNKSANLFGHAIAFAAHNHQVWIKMKTLLLLDMSGRR